MKSQEPRILRNYRNASPTRFHELNQRVSKSLSDKTRFSDKIWASNPTLPESYFAASEKHDAVYHESMLGNKLVIAEREVIQAQIVIYLDEIVAILELAALHNPEILIASGFDLSKERRVHSRSKATAEARNATHAGKEDGESGAPA